MAASNFNFADPPALSEILKCTHCGLCLNQCPTYRVLGWEMDSPRGRIRLMRGVTEGLFEVTPTFAEHMDVCLACRACQTACPANLNFGQMVEAARAQALQTLPQKPLPRFFRWLVFKQLFPHPRRLIAAATLVKFYQRSGLQSLARKLRLIPPGLRESEALLPRLPDKFFTPTSTPLPCSNGGGAGGGGRVAFLAGCVMSTVYADTDAATVRVLARNGFDVAMPKHQTCCGALAIHAGERATAKEMAMRNIDAFLPPSPSPVGTGEGEGGKGDGNGGYAAILVNASGCGVAMKEYKDLLADDPEYANKAREFSDLVQDVTEFLAAHGIEKPTREIRARVTYQDPCHLAHGQGIRAQPRALLNQIPGLQLIEMRDADRCCGSAGIYNITHPDIAAEILDEKMTNIAATRPDIIVTANAGCLLQLQQGVRRAGLKAEVLHVMDLLDRAYR
ncbi:MAG: 4Fe-4S dicluster domain-containing protein [Chloroflexi bacterium]|nr:4Fe-4S dicluster domain-containing protein [Chloroflexota bacterium]